MPNITPLFCSIAILGALVSSVRAASLATAFDGPNGDAYSDGDKFSILTGDTPVTIHSLDLHMGEVTADVQVWINPEGFFDWMYKSGVHEKVMEIDDVTGLGQGLATPLPAFSPPIEIPANSNLGFYVTLNNSGGGNMYHSDGVTQNAVFASDDFISITEGISQRHFMSAFHIPTRWNGVVHYSYLNSPTMSPTLTLAPTETASDQPSASPSNQPSTTPSQQPSLLDNPSSLPSFSPSQAPSQTPSEAPSHVPSSTPSDAPTREPSRRTTRLPTKAPIMNAVGTASPSMVPSSNSSLYPSESPSPKPSAGAAGHSLSLPGFVAVLTSAAVALGYLL